MARRLFLLLALSFLVASCSEEEAELSVDLKTDFLAGVEFTEIRAEVRDATDVEERVLGSVLTRAQRGVDFIRGRRVAQFAGATSGARRVFVTLIDPGGRGFITRTTLLETSGSYALTVVITRDCRDVVCPASGDPPTHTTCSGGRCVDPRCRPGSVDETCGVPECSGDTQCLPRVACAEGVCASGSCLFRGRVDGCASGEVCDPEDGCVPLPPEDAGPEGDAGPPIDGGPLPDSGHDDAGDASSDGGVAPPDAGGSPPDTGPPPDAGDHDGGCVGVGTMCPVIGAHGDCAIGVRRCISGVIQCIGPDPRPEVCDGNDNDCDNIPDDGDPESGGACTTTMMGRCRPGTEHCNASAGMLECRPNFSPVAELCGDSIDQDCSGLCNDDCPLGFTRLPGASSPIYAGGAEVSSGNCPAATAVITGFGTALEGGALTVAAAHGKCTRPEIMVTAGTPSIRYTSASDTINIGNSSGEVQTACPAGYVATGITGKHTTSGRTIINQLAVSCRQLVLVGVPGDPYSLEMTPSYLSGPVMAAPVGNGASGEPFDFECPEGEVLIGVRGARESPFPYSMTSFGVRCGSLSLTVDTSTGC